MSGQRANMEAAKTRLARAVYSVARNAVRARRGTAAQLRSRTLARHERLTAAEVNAESLRLARAVIFRAFHSVPYYHRVFLEAGISPRDIRSFDDLRRLPLLRKADVVAAGDDLASRGRARLGAEWDATCGSTGVPMRFLKSRAARTATIANEERCWRWYGVHPGAPLSMIWGADRDVSPEQDAAALKRRLLGIHNLNAFLLDEERCRTFLALLERHKPELIVGYASALAVFARWLETTGQHLRHPPIAIRSTAEVLRLDDREVISRVMRAPLYDFYGSRDGGPIAGEAVAGNGLHVFSDVTWVEILRPDGQPTAVGEVGEIVVTKLHEHAMPFIRYATEDRAMWLPDTDGGLPFRRIGAPSHRQVAEWWPQR